MGWIHGQIERQKVAERLKETRSFLFKNTVASSIIVWMDTISNDSPEFGGPDRFQIFKVD